MENIKKEFISFEKYFKIYIKTTKVRDITRNYISTPTYDYDDYTIEQFLILYKLNRMEEIGIINETIANDLKGILDMKRHVGAIIEEETKKELYVLSYKSTDLPKLHKMVKTIDNHLKKYHLTPDDISFKDMLDASVKAENTEPIKDDNNIKVKKME